MSHWQSGRYSASRVTCRRGAPRPPPHRPPPHRLPPHRPATRRPATRDLTAPPCRLQYLATFRAGFDEGLSEVQLSFMQSDGGLTQVDHFSGHRAILSGPAGGYVGYALTTRWDGMDRSTPMQVRGDGE